MIDKSSRRWSRRIASNSSTLDLTSGPLRQSQNTTNKRSTRERWGQIKPLQRRVVP